MVTASPKGGKAPLDPSSVEMFKADESSASFLKSQTALWEKTEPISSFLGKTSEFAGLFFPGGHGPMFDLAVDKESIALINEFVAANKPVGAVCHGPAVFVNVTLPGGRHLLTGKEVTGFSNAEEEAVGLTKHVPFSLEDRIKEAGAIYKKAPELWAPYVLVADDGKLITGQNPGSSKAVGEAFAKALGL